MDATGPTFQYDTETKALTIVMPSGNRVIVSDTADLLSVADGNGNRITLAPAGISLESAGNLNIHACGNISLSTDGRLDLAAKEEIKVACGNLALDAKTTLSARAGTTAELSGNVGAKLSASGETVIKGGIVLIN